NKALEEILSKRSPPRTKREVIVAIYFKIGGWHWADKIERWAAKSPLVARYPQTRYSSIYRGMPIWATRVTYVFGVGRTFRINNVMVGSDKLGHFVSQGFKYMRRELRGMSDERIIKRGRYAERWIFGQFTTGIFSNADLVANYEGYRFYQSLFQDDLTEGKPAILKWEDGRYQMQRRFTFADHINNYWDEALNPSYSVPAVDKRLRQAIKKLCPEYLANPSFYTINDDAELWARYSRLGLKDARQNQFQVVCDDTPP
ncbi:MAG: hypothetical protein ACR2PJ_00540, partial [Pseudomonadales bacterium]